MASVDFLMPSLGADMTEAKLVAWKVKPGDEVARGAVVAEVDTAKGVIDVECFTSGKVLELVAREGETYPVNAVLARIATSAEVAAGPNAKQVPEMGLKSVETPQQAKQVVSAVPVDSPSASKPAVGATTRLKISPFAKRRAMELGVKLEQLIGSGAAGEITAIDVEQEAGKLLHVEALRTGEASGRQGAERSRQRMREAIAVAMARSNREIPHYYLSTSVEMKRADEWLQQENERRSVSQRLLPVVLTLKAMGLALRQVPELNGFWEEGRFRQASGIHIGFAIAMRGGGLVTPAIHDVDQLNLDQLMTNVSELIPRARSGKLRSSELTDAGITLTHLGELGVDSVWGVIYPPQVAIVGAGRTKLQPWITEGRVVISPVMELTLAGDHRASDGLTGGRLLNSLQQHLQSPESL